MINNLFLAIVFLTSPPNSISLEQSKGYEYLTPVINRVAVEFELLGDKQPWLMNSEYKYNNQRQNWFHGDLVSLQEIWKNTKDCPPISDCWRFPTRELILELLAFNIQYGNLIEKRAEYDHAFEFDMTQLIRENKFRYKFWDNISDAKNEAYNIYLRRQLLRDAKDMIGNYHYYNAIYPCHVPLRHFSKLY